jgi:hypothetical protein
MLSLLRECGQEQSGRSEAPLPDSGVDGLVAGEALLAGQDAAAFVLALLTEITEILRWELLAWVRDSSASG